MITRLAKETRDLLPVFVGTLLFISLPFVIWRPETDAFGIVAFGCGCAIMAGSCFGNEFQRRTLPLLLAQPIPRRRLWLEKMLVLASGMIISLGVLWFFLHSYRRQSLSDAGFLAASALIPLCAFCGAPCLTLQVRSGIAGVVFSLAIPAMLMIITALVNSRLGSSETTEFVSNIAVLSVYCAVAYWRGYAEFKKLQVLDGLSSTDLRLPARVEDLIVRSTQSIFGRFTGQFPTLLKKELRLQQISFLMAGFFCIAAVGGALLYKLRPDWGGPVLAAAYPIYLIVLPFIIGALSVAEERAWGVAEWHLTLPPSARKQWFAKVLAAVWTTLLLGWLLPILVFISTEGLFGGPGFDNGRQLAALVPVCLLSQLLFTIVAVYAGSYSNTTLRAVLMAVGIVLAMLWCTRFGPAQILPVGAGPVVGISNSCSWLFPATLAVLVLLGVGSRFALRNFRLPRTRYRTLFRQVLVLLFVTWVFECIIAVFWRFGSGLLV
jgi:ABC-type transport system involved in multi-copper enzyme maturation permease subunit